MAIFNKILNILVCVLAICAVVFGYILFQKRQELRSRGDRMAEMINTVSGILDKSSGTKFALSLSPRQLELDQNINPKASENAKKSLYHDNYQNIANVLAPFKRQANDIVTQRDILGDTLYKSMVALDAPQPDTFAASGFQEISSYPEKTEALLGVTQKINTRDNALIKQIVATASLIGFTMDDVALKSFDDYATSLEEFGKKVALLKTRTATYEQHIKKVCDVLELTSPTLDGEDFAEALTPVVDAIQGVKDEFAACKKDLTSAKNSLAEVQGKLDQAIEQVSKFEQRVKVLEKEVSTLRGDDPVEGPKAGPVGADFLVKKLEGNVLKVNKKWDFVVIDLGKTAKKNKMMRGANGNKEVTIALPEGKVMDISRNNKFLGQIKIIRVNDNCAIGDIIQDNKQGTIEPGDKVYFARTTNKAKEAADDDDAEVNKADDDDDAAVANEDDDDEGDDDAADEDEDDE